MKVIWQISEDYQRWRDFPTHLQDYVEKQWQDWRDNGKPGYDLVIEYSWPWKKGDIEYSTPYQIVCEANGTIKQENKSTSFKRAVRRLVYTHPTEHV